MAYSPVAQIYSAFGPVRGPGAYLTMSGYSASEGGVYALPPGVIAGPPGAAVVSPRVKAIMAAQARRGGGPAGTRHTVRRVRGGAIAPAPQVPLWMTPGARPQRQLGAYGGFGMPGTILMSPGTARAVPAGKGFQMWNPTRRLGELPPGLGSDAAFATAHLGQPKQTGEYYGVDALPLSATSGDVVRRACEIGQKGMRGRCKTAGFQFGVPGTPPAAPASGLYTTALTSIKSFVDQIKAATIDPKTALPASLAAVTQPPSGSAAADIAAWNDFQHYRDVSLPLARQEGQILWDSAHLPAGGGTTTIVPVSNGGSATTTTTIPATSGTVTQPTTTYAQPQQPATYVGPDIYGNDPYATAPTSVGTQNVVPLQAAASIVPTADGGVATATGADASVQPTGTAEETPKPKSKAGVAVAVLGAAALFLYMRHRKKKHA